MVVVFLHKKKLYKNDPILLYTATLQGTMIE